MLLIAIMLSKYYNHLSLKQLLPSLQQLGMDFEDSNIINDSQEQYSSIKPPMKNKLPQRIYKLYIKPESLCLEDFALPPSPKMNSQVCAKSLKSGDLLVQCFDCGIDNSCCICIDCFNNGEHKNHKYRIRQASGGCCDCGDKQAWRQKGFCKNHSGNLLQFQIDRQVQKKVKKRFHEILYLYFYFNLQQQNKNKTVLFSQKLIEILIKINKNNIYYNKLFYLSLCSRFQFSINKEFDKFSVLKNILNSTVSVNYYHLWAQFFILLFPYYPFKIELLRSFIEMYGSIIKCDDRALSFCGSLSCQLLTSYQLVQKYVSTCNVGIGQWQNFPKLSQEPNSKMIKKLYLRMFCDLQYINKLPMRSSLAYWQMHIKNERSLDNIFQYYQDLIQFAESKQKNNYNFNQIILSTVQAFYIEFEFFQLFINILKVAKNSKPIMHFILNYLWGKLLRTFPRSASNLIPIFRPYDRAFFLALFTHFNFQFQSVDKIKQYRKELCQILNIDFRQLDQSLNIFRQRLIQTYFIYLATLVESGFGQSMHYYIYFYKLKYKLVSAIDIISIKITLLMSPQCGFLDLRMLIRLEDYEAKYKLNQKKTFLNTILKMLHYLYTFKINEAYIANLLEPGCNLFNPQITDFLSRFFNMNKGTVSIQKLNIIKNKMLSSSITVIQDWLQKNTVLNKQKKQFVMKIQSSGQSLNLSDLWESEFQTDNTFPDPFISMQCIRNQNLEIFFRIWTPETIQSLIELIKNVYQQNTEIQGEHLISGILLLFIHSRPTSQSFMKLKMVVYPLLNKLPIAIQEKLKAHGFFNKDSGDSEIIEEKAEKKKKIQAIKQKKMEKMKQKQDKAVYLLQMEEQEPHFLKKISDSTLGCEFQSQVCCICRNEADPFLGYLVRVEERDYERLFRLGPGKKTITFYSCFHAFHHSCIKTLLGKNQFIICPVCKTRMQIYLGLPNKDISILHCNELNLQIFSTGCIDEQRPFEDVTIQMINSIYHFILTFIMNRGQNVEKQIQLYRILFFYLRKSMKTKELEENEAKMQKMLELRKEIIKNSMGRKLRSAGKIGNFKQQRKAQSINENSEEIIKGQKKELQTEFLYPTFIKTVFGFFKALSANSGPSSFQNYLQEDIQDQKTKLVKGILKVLSRESTQLQEQFSIDLDMTFNPNFIINLPPLYSGVDQNRVCSTCSKISSNIVLCLICSWRGCLFCIKGRMDNTIMHSQLEHGSSMGIYMKLESSMAFYENNFGVGTIGYLYQNQWGQSTQKNFEWDRFQLNKNLIKEIEKTLVKDKILTKLKKQQNQ